MLKPYRTIEDVLRSPWGELIPTAEAEAPASDRVLRSTKLEDSIYADVRSGDDALAQLELEAGKKLSSFPALSRDVYQTFYSLTPKKVEEAHLSTAARKFNAPLLDHIVQSEDYSVLKSVCEGRELPAYEAASEFISRTAEELEDLLSDLSGEKGTLNTLEKLEAQETKAREDLTALLDRLRKTQGRNETLEQAVIDAANQAESKRRQVEAVGKMADTAAAGNKDTVATAISKAVKAAADKAEEIQAIVGAWGDDPGDLTRSESNMELLALVRKSEPLRAIAKCLGRFREIFAQGKRNGYAYGRGETYSLELGSDISRALTSELAMLAAPETTPLFLQKYQRKQIKQYRRREPIYKGAGDIICCLDESTSTKGDPAAWGKAVAITLLDIAADKGRKFALIHFSGSDSFQTDLFLPGQYTLSDKLRAGETFLGGGTNFVTPIDEAVRLIEQKGFENADIVFLTDGECALPASYADALHAKQTEQRFTITGVLLDSGKPGMDFSLQTFCQNIYRTSELAGDEVVERLVSQRL